MPQEIKDSLIKAADDLDPEELDSVEDQLLPLLTEDWPETAKPGGGT